MLRELISFFQRAQPLRDMEAAFSDMMRRAYDLTTAAGQIYFAGDATPDQRSQIYASDIEINKLQRRIRRQVIAHLSLSANTGSLSYCVLLVSLVKDVERIGDYAKNLTEIVDFYAGPPPDDELVAELRSIRQGVEQAFETTLELFASSEQDRAFGVVRRGRDLTQRCDELILRIAGSEYNAKTAAAVLLATRYYKRIGAHVLNVLSSVVMPLHKLDYFDEDEVPEDFRPKGET